VHKGQLEQVTAMMAEAARTMKVGDPTDPATDLGPVVNKTQFERIQRYIQAGIDEGARLALGGPGRPEGLEVGYFVRPTLFADVTPDMTIAREEIFGPVLSVMPYADAEEAIAIANATPYGLGGYVFAASREEGLAVARRIRAGRVAVNGAAAPTSAPMGGYKQSGNGREMGVFGLEEYLETKAIFGVAA
jgi:aldehyde dehydrogenase (NAD+)